ncbi:SGNH/GDSL hydrolase family protein [Engelhardtia mirabilis]|uniref:SGNH/GDSL hydrolase family protein n=1 Tax=Engelhardtia mirabilis TaxID=2528011 RepID=UPI0011A12656
MPPLTSPKRRLLVASVTLLVCLAAAELGVRLAGLAAGTLPRAPYGGGDVEALLAWQQDFGARGEVFGGQTHDPLLGWVPAPGLRDFVEPGHPPRSTNSVGMRGQAEFALEPTEGLVRVATIGDSFTFGTHQKDERIWPARLSEASLSQGSRPFEVLNFGVPGYGTDQALLRLERDVLPYRPDVVVWGIFETNPSRSRRLFSYYAKPRFDLAGGELRLGHTPVPAPGELATAVWDVPLAASPCHLLRWLQISRVEVVGPGTAPLLELHRALLARAARACEEAGAKLLVVPIPTLRWAELPPSATELATHAMAAEGAFSSHDLRPIFEGTAKAGAGPPLYIPGRHFSAEGHWMVANTIAGRIDELGWL